MRTFLTRLVIPIGDLLIAPFVFLSAALMRLVRTAGVARMPLTRRILFGVGIYPLREHYYDPLFNYTRLRNLGGVRALPGLDLNVAGQLHLLSEFSFTDELLAIPMDQRRENEFYYNNGWFGSGDAEFLYNMIRRFRPRRVLEVGGGFTTLLANQALRRNAADDPAYRFHHWCVEPYENPWLNRLDVQVIRKRVEDLQVSEIPALERNDILFIDSSHVIRAQGDVLFELQQLVPSLAPGVLVHFHDVFTPRDYPARQWKDGWFFFNEQYLLESFLALNPSFRVIGAVNFLAHEHPDALARACPIFDRERQFREPGSFWIQRV